MLTRLEGVWFGDLNGRRVIIIDPEIAEENVLKIVDDFISERRRHGRRNEQRGGEVLVRSTVEQDVEM